MVKLDIDELQTLDYVSKYILKFLKLGLSIEDIEKKLELDISKGVQGLILEGILREDLTIRYQTVKEYNDLRAE